MQHEHIQHQTHSSNPTHTEQPVHVTVTTHDQRVPVVGDHVLYVLPQESACRYPGHIRPAVIVRTWGESAKVAVQLQVFTDGTNDYDHGHTGASGIMWKASVPYSEDATPGTWHWPTKKD
jgi:hypothetical protein